MRRLLCTALCLAATAQAQPIDLDVVHGLLGMTGDRIALEVGVVPDSVRPFVPEGAEVLATLTSEQGPHVVTVVRLASDLEAAAEAYRARGVPGWPLANVPTRGSATSTAAHFTFRPRGGTQAEVAFTARPAGTGSLAVVTMAPERQPPDVPRTREEWERESVARHLPGLAPPPGGRHLGGSRGGSSDYYRSRTHLKGDLGLEAVAAHYTEHMAAAGWTPVASAVSGGLAHSTWVQTLEGDLVTATLQTLSGGLGDFEVVVAVIGPER